MKINTILVTMVIASSFWGTAGDGNYLQGLNNLFASEGEADRVMTVFIQMEGDVPDATQAQLNAYGNELVGECLSKKLGLIALTGDKRYEAGQFQLDELTYSYTNDRRRLGSYSYHGMGACRNCCSKCRCRDRWQLPESVQRDLRASAQGIEKQLSACMKTGSCKTSGNPACTMSVKTVTYEIG